MLIFYEYMQQPRYWIARDDEGFWLVPARDQGWHERTQFVGHVMNLQEVRDFEGIDLGVPLN